MVQYSGNMSADALEAALRDSIGNELRQTNRAFMQDLQDRLEALGIPVGMWFFLRILWDEDGISQRELSQRVGTMEPTTVEQLRNMEKRGFIDRHRCTDDRRKMHVYLTEAGRELKYQLMPLGVAVNVAALDGLSEAEIASLRTVLGRMRRNLESEIAARRAGAEPAKPRRRAGA
jgi:DNA-binding MarR family transcriptional regulator